MPTIHYESTQPVDAIVVNTLDNKKYPWRFEVKERKEKNAARKLGLIVCQAHRCACDITLPEAYTTDRITGGQIAGRLYWLTVNFHPSFHVFLFCQIYRLTKILSFISLFDTVRPSYHYNFLTVKTSNIMYFILFTFLNNVLAFMAIYTATVSVVKPNLKIHYLT